MNLNQARGLREGAKTEAGEALQASQNVAAPGVEETLHGLALVKTHLEQIRKNLGALISGGVNTENVKQAMGHTTSMLLRVSELEAMAKALSDGVGQLAPMMNAVKAKIDDI